MPPALYHLHGSSVQAQLAIRDDGQAFKRYKVPNLPYGGWRWSRWEPSDEQPVFQPGDGDPNLNWGEGNGYGWVPAYYGPGIRLPKA